MQRCASCPLLEVRGFIRGRRYEKREGVCGEDGAFIRGVQWQTECDASHNQRVEEKARKEVEKARKEVEKARKEAEDAEDKMEKAEDKARSSEAKVGVAKGEQWEWHQRFAEEKGRREQAILEMMESEKLAEQCKRDAGVERLWRKRIEGELDDEKKARKEAEEKARKLACELEAEKKARKEAEEKARKLAEELEESLVEKKKKKDLMKANHDIAMGALHEMSKIFNQRTETEPFNSDDEPSK